MNIFDFQNYVTTELVSDSAGVSDSGAHRGLGIFSFWIEIPLFMVHAVDQ